LKQEIKNVLQSKREGRIELAALSFSRKIEMLEKLRERNRAIAASRRNSG
jgi:hypothetical protein